MAKSKYEGGARVTTFRLPKLWFDVAKSGVLKYLERYEIQPPILEPEGIEKLRIESNGNTIWPGITNPKEKLMITTNESAGVGVTKPKKTLVAKKTVPKNLVEKLKELDPNIVIPEVLNKK